MAHKQIHDNKRIAKNTAFLYIRMLIVLVVSIYTTRVVLQTLGVVDYGIYNVVAGFVSMLSFLNTSMSVGIQRFYNYESSVHNGIQQNTIFNTAIQIQITIAIIIIILLESIGLWYINCKMIIPPDRLIAANWVFQCSVISLIIIVIQVPFTGLILSRERMNYYAYVSIIDVFLKLFIVLSLPYINNDRLIFYGFLSLIINTIDLILYYIYCKRYFNDIWFERCFNSKLYKRIISFTGWNLLDMFAYTLKGQGANVLLNAYFGPIVNAARGIANQISGALSGFSMNLVTAFRPQLIGSYAEGNISRTKILMYTMSNISYALLCMLSIPIVLEMNYVLTIWLGDDFPEYTISFATLVLIDMTLSSLNTPISQVMQAVGKLKKYQIVRGFIVFSTFPLSWLALNAGFDPNIVFIISIIITIINQFVSLIILHEYFQFSYSDYFSKVVIPCILFTLFVPVIPFIINQTMNESLFRFFIVSISTLLSSICICFFIMINRETRTMILCKFLKYKQTSK